MRLRWRTGRAARRRARRLRVQPACGAGVVAVVFTAMISVAQATRLLRPPRVVTFSFVTPRLAVLQWKPIQIVYSGDGQAFLAGTGSTSSHLVWTTWSSRQGRGRGADWHNNCVPNCAEGTFTAYPATVRVYRPRRVAGYLLFTRMTTTYIRTQPPYPGYRRPAVTYKLDYDARTNTLFWSVP